MFTEEVREGMGWRANTVVVGGGITGLSIAVHTARRLDPLREPVMVLERDHLGSGSSGGADGTLRQYYASPVTAGMARDSLRVYASFEERVGRSIGFLRCGVLTISPSAQAADRKALRQNLRILCELGIEAREMDAAAMRELIGGIEVSDDARGVFEPQTGFVDPAATVEAMAALARSSGATIRCASEVSEVLVDGGRVRGVRTGEETVECERVVIAAGGWSGGLLSRLGVDLPLRAMRVPQHFVSTPGASDDEPGCESDPLAGDSLEASGATRFYDAESGELVAAALEDEDASEVRRAAHPVLLDQELGFYARCEPCTGRTRVGRLGYEGWEEVDRPADTATQADVDFGRWARETLARRLPAYAQSRDEGSTPWCCSLTPDAQALLGPTGGVEGLFVASGFSGHGFQLAPAVGEGMAQMLAGQPVSAFDPVFFDPGRFAAVPAARSGGAFGL
ncbi:MAG: FAD-binding oxidoreductase [Planctomycetota bacterium]|jgi:glycine/D-amino acid oxidase-like deaminating enzyme|nr:FAD-binding oxidoreductase [Planctomycetota bacterium]MDP6989967.1 FAD-binding oxidoreductase [Planctomycetota bacterium]